ncbi:MAG: PEP-CTERM sorting domain-containing protein [Pirellulaceae bacterium]
MHGFTSRRRHLLICVLAAIGVLTILGGSAHATIVSYYFKLNTADVIGFASYELPPPESLVIRSTSNSITVGYRLKTFSFVWNGEQYLSDYDAPYPPYVAVRDAFIPLPPEPEWNRGWDDVWFNNTVRSAAGKVLSVELAFGTGAELTDTVIDSPALPADLTTWPFDGGPWFLGYEGEVRVLNDYAAQFGFLHSRVTAPGGRFLDDLDSVWLGASGDFQSRAAWSDGSVPSETQRALFSLASIGSAPEVVRFDDNVSVAAVEFLGDRNLEFELNGCALSINQGLVIGQDGGTDVKLALNNGWVDAPALIVGGSGKGTLNVSETWINAQELIVGDKSGSTGEVLIDGGGSRLSITGPLVVGASGTGKLTVDNGADLELFDNVVVGQESTGSGEFNVKGPLGPSSLLSANRFVVGGRGQGTLNLSGIEVFYTTLVVGDETDSTGEVTLSGAGMKWETDYIDSPVTVGKAGNGSLTIADGAEMTLRNGSLWNTVIIGHEAGSLGTVVVQGAGSKLLAQSEIVVGYSGSGSLTIRDGGLVGGVGLGPSYTDVTIGSQDSFSTAGRGEVLVDGIGSKLLASNLVVGAAGQGQLTIQNGGNVEVYGFSHVKIGDSAFDDTRSQLIVKDPGSQLTQGAFNFGFDIGFWEPADMKIQNGALVWNRGDANVARILSAAPSTVLVDGAGSLWRSGDIHPDGLAGSITLNNNAVLTVSNDGSVETGVLTNFKSSHADIVLDNGHLRVALLDLKQGGSLTGNGTINGDVVTNGVITPGQSPGKLTVLGDYQQLADGLLKIELAGYTFGTEFDLLEVGGMATLGGTLEISLLGGFQPTPTDTFDFLTAGSIEGTFDKLLFGGGTVDVNYLTSGVRLSNFHLSEVPEPSSMVLLVMGLLGMLAYTRHRRRS